MQVHYRQIYSHLPPYIKQMIETLENTEKPNNGHAEYLDRRLTEAPMHASMKCQKNQRPFVPANILALKQEYNFLRKN